MEPRLILLATAAFVVGALGAFASFYLSGNAAKQVTTQVTGKALVGGTFALTDHKGRRVTEKDFEGRFLLVQFGFTYCPDIRSIELQAMTEALERLGEKGDKVTPVFITVDPQRDTVEQMAFYVSNKFTLSITFGQDLGDRDWLTARRDHVQEVILGYLRPQPS